MLLLLFRLHTQARARAHARTHTHIHTACIRRQYVLLPITIYNETVILSPWAYLHVVGMSRFISGDINQRSLPTPFMFGVCFCLYNPFNYISLHKFSQHCSVFSFCSSVLLSALLVLSIIHSFMIETEIRTGCGLLDPTHLFGPDLGGWVGQAQSIDWSLWTLIC